MTGNGDARIPILVVIGAAGLYDLTDAFTAAGYNVVNVDCGERAVATTCEKADLILLDVKRIKAAGKFPPKLTSSRATASANTTPCLPPVRSTSVPACALYGAAAS
ncbi:response regulator [Paractinoplanes rishiriensis]|uniref:Uncharacterized protein n=1 Tax=Paractinoplanes rishiriensis TaxID=1050105 RepID=A0A919K6A9_9ACTN|nr:hypothetical protein [Actinoplanes rishiriensis]GIF01732.1 hypothetical protein Ari01nite_91960 [Actinoplanes rishiriensis]